VGEGGEDAPRRIALFSLGTMAVYRGLRTVLVEEGAERVAEEVMVRCTDKVSRKYVERLRTKLQGGYVD